MNVSITIPSSLKSTERFNEARSEWFVLEFKDEV